MDIFGAISKRMTIRDFRYKPVAMEVVEKLIDAGMKAPSHDRMRRWEFIVVQDRITREKMVEHILEPTTLDGAVEVVDRWG